VDRLHPLARDVLSSRHALVHGGMGELVAADQVADRVDRVDAGSQPFVDLHEARLAELEPNFLEADLLAPGCAPCLLYTSPSPRD